ncbi:hypothetical protein [Tenacibaculum caenipelagi]|uniref:Uncharacterized protein n=1 Tax=Tenacibaculum caenipelagi TaxID=1325435 RepID=A0A4R6TIL5_9FLAO|nr:hypothetical protein [Tenacibaculum caenipelagi]TDQ29961.1 hypothetical protein DFQ07_0291 [Tenacibaculum caenipelagi]
MASTLQDTTGTLFSNVDSGNPLLYTNITPELGEWSAVVLPEDSTYKESTLTLSKATTLSVYFLFAETTPDKENITEYIDEVRAYLQAYRQNFTNNITTAWLLDINSKPTKENVIAINFYVNSQNVIKVSQTFNYTMGNGFATLSIRNNTEVSFIPEGAATQIQLSYDSNSPNISFDSKEYGSNTLLNKDVSVSFTQYNCGAFSFPLGFNLESDFKAFFLDTSYYYQEPTNSSIVKYSYPIFKPQSEVEYAMTQAAINPLDIGNKNDLNTYFAFTGTTFNSSTKEEKPCCLPSFFSINTGYPIALWPKVNLIENTNPSNNLTPLPNSSLLLISPRDINETERFYLQPEGDFFLDPESNQADENGQFDFLPGLSGTEVITFTPYSIKNEAPTGDIIRFKSKQPAYAPNFPAQELSLINPGTNNPTLENTYLTSWANIISEIAENVQYVSQPEGASLFAKDHGVSQANTGKSNLLGFYEPSIDMPQQDFYVPIAPYLGMEVDSPKPEDDNLTTFESEVLSKERKTLITKQLTQQRASKSAIKRAKLLSNEDSSYTSSTTPQGLIANVNDNGSWSMLNLGQNDIHQGAIPEYLYPENQVPTNPSQYQMSFINLSTTLQSAFLTNQQFLVATQSNHLGTLFSKSGEQGGQTTAEAIFNNKMSIEDWPFDINVGTTNTYADYNNVVIFKFCKGTLLERVKDPKTWTQPNTFNTEGVDDPANAYQQLIAISSWIQSYIEDAEKAYQYGLEHPESNQAILYEKFHNIINNKEWNGILVLKADIDLQEFPQQLKGLISGINLTRFNAHHFGIEVNKVNADGEIQMEKNSSLFGLINYLDTAYQQQLLQGLNINKPVPPLAGATYDFKVLQLQVLFENTAIKFFQSKVQLTMNNLFSDTIIGTNNKYGSKTLNTVVLDGTYQDHDGTPVYVFENNDDNLFYFDSNLLKNVEITKIQFNTLTTDPIATYIESRFTMWGYLNYAVMKTTTPATDEIEENTIVLDAFSFGNGDGTDSDIIDGLNYSNLYIDMAFDISTPTVVDYAFDASNIVFNSNLSTARQLSLYPNFALQINNLVSGDDDTMPPSLGYLNLSLPGINTRGLSGNWYGLEMTLNMGTPGELASSLDFNASLLIAWSPGNKATDTAYNAFVGIKLPGTSSNAKLLSLQGVLKLSIDTLKLEYVEAQQSYLMTLSKIALKFLGILKLPPGGSTNFLLFGNPNPGATAKSLGWYAAYNKTKS